jgi:hypothetical protein
LPKDTDSPEGCSVLGAIHGRLSIDQPVAKKTPNIIFLSNALTIIGRTQHLFNRCRTVVRPKRSVYQQRFKDSRSLMMGQVEEKLSVDIF